MGYHPLRYSVQGGMVAVPSNRYPPSARHYTLYSQSVGRCAMTYTVWVHGIFQNISGILEYMMWLGSGLK